MAKRITSTVVLWLLLLAVLWKFGTDGAVAAIVVISVLTLRELYRLMAAAGNAPFSGMGMLFGGLITLGPWTEARLGIPSHPLIALATITRGRRARGAQALRLTLASVAAAALRIMGYGLVPVAAIWNE